MSKETKATLEEKIRDHERTIGNLMVRSQRQAREIDRHRRALEAGSRRYKREQNRARQAQERILQQANHRAEQLELAGQEQALLRLQADMDSMKAHKIMHQARLRADKLAAKLLHRAGELGKERQSWAAAVAGRERALDNANKRARGLQESLRKAKAQVAELRRLRKIELEHQDRLVAQILQLRQSLRDANTSVIMEALGGGLEIRPLSGRQHEDTRGYSPAARRAAEGWVK